MCNLLLIVFWYFFACCKIACNFRYLSQLCNDLELLFSCVSQVQLVIRNPLSVLRVGTSIKDIAVLPSGRRWLQLSLETYHHYSKTLLQAFQTLPALTKWIKTKITCLILHVAKARQLVKLKRIKVVTNYQVI